MPLVNKLTNVADAIREKTGSTGSLTLDGMVTAIESIEGGGSGGNSKDCLAERITDTLTQYSNSNISTIARYAFYYCSSLESVSFPVCTSIGSSAFGYCSSIKYANFSACTNIGGYAFYSCTFLQSVNSPVCTTIGERAFAGCAFLKSIDFPSCTTIGSYAFSNCSYIKTVYFPVCTSIKNDTFNGCNNLKSVNLPVCTTIENSAFYVCDHLSNLTLGASKVCTLTNSKAFNGTPIKSGTGYIYVPSSLVASYKTATNWTYFSNQILSIGTIIEEPEIKIITFTIDGVEYSAEEGMTWMDWCYSDYNDDVLFIIGIGYVEEISTGYAVDNGSAYVLPSATISEGYSYTTEEYEDDSIW